MKIYKHNNQTGHMDPIDTLYLIGVGQDSTSTPIFDIRMRDDKLEMMAYGSKVIIEPLANNMIAVYLGDPHAD